MSKTIETVQRIYQAFGSGDVAAILEHIAPDVAWEYGWAETPIPWLVPGRGREHVASFFGVVGRELEFHRFEVNHLLGGDKVVVALVSLEVAVRSTGKRIVETDEPHIWHFDERGQVCKFRHAADTLQHARALEA
jgi:uncharacterized protein